MESFVTKDIYFKFERQAFGSGRRPDKFLIDSFCFDGESEIFKHQDFKPHRLSGNQYLKLFCRCGACNFNDDGRWMNEYCCESCGKYVTVYRRNPDDQETSSSGRGSSAGRKQQ